MTDKTFKAVVDVVKGMEVHSQVRDFTFVMDEPVASGGSNKGMNPIEALLSALGGCKAIVIKAFAKAHHMNIQKASLTIEGTLDVDGFRGTNPNAKIGLGVIKTTYHIQADNTKEEIEEFIEFVDHTCPVRDTLAHSPELETELIIE